LLTEQCYDETHLRTHIEGTPFLCCVCKKSFTEYCAWKWHLHAQNGVWPFLCDIYNKTFRQQSDV